MKKKSAKQLDAEIVTALAPGPKIVNVYVRSPDAADVVDPSEASLRWTEESRPLHWFVVEGGQGVDRYAQSLDKQDRDRIRAIEKWAKSRGGLSKAIHERPVLAYASGDVIDGVHRLVAALQRGLSTVTVLIAHEKQP